MRENRNSAFLRAQLATIGIFIADPTAALSTAVVEVQPAPVDRALVRDILVCAGAPECDLEWLTASCPSVEAAQAYEPFRIAWCVVCDASVLCDNDGCIACRSAGDSRPAP